MLRGAFIIAVLVGTLAGFESWLWLREAATDPTRFAGTYTSGYFVPDDLLGHGPAKGVSVTASKYVGDSLIYSVVYTIGADGLRIAPPHAPDAKGCVLFFGDSITFGEGVNDTETMPYQVGLKVAGRYRVYNFGFHGYGPHQMLAALEGGRVASLIECMPMHIVYQTIIPHVERAVGLTLWDNHGPRYVPNPTGGVRHAGHFDDGEALPRLEHWLRQSVLYDTVFGRRRSVRAQDVDLYARIVAQARAVVESCYPGARFDVLLWDDRGIHTHDQVLTALEAKGLRLHRMTAVLPGYATDKTAYELHLHDHHPNSRTHGLIADYVVDHILEPGSRTDHVPDMQREQ